MRAHRECVRVAMETEVLGQRDGHPNPVPSVHTILRRLVIICHEQERLDQSHVVVFTFDLVQFLATVSAKG